MSKNIKKGASVRIKLIIHKQVMYFACAVIGVMIILLFLFMLALLFVDNIFISRVKNNL